MYVQFLRMFSVNCLISLQVKKYSSTEIINSEPIQCVTKQIPFKETQIKKNLVSLLFFLFCLLLKLNSLQSVE